MARASWKLCSMSGLHTPSASFSRGLSSASPSSSLPPLGEGAGTHSADVVRPQDGGHNAADGWSAQQWGGHRKGGTTKQQNLEERTKSVSGAMGNMKLISIFL